MTAPVTLFGQIQLVGTLIDSGVNGDFWMAGEHHPGQLWPRLAEGKRRD